MGEREIDNRRELGRTRCEAFIVGIEVGWDFKEIDGDMEDTRGFKAATRKKKGISTRY